ncbi:cell division protein FtsQ/DivIB [Bulleidia sp. zg-1006]|uniref:cell division protein FtsQ/DivIB n=1 Tax=Bulleidia sp. zg-1006 TaxID=2806552 RepID=UPI00193AB3C4|nr:FtsQ-type POTRA domain-containing protein [Bulleidia sp. zg-1006]QRG87404.1 FtsQ-type POTRA domain-containing protein [Bulleidia sp. zg-1006]
MARKEKINVVESVLISKRRANNRLNYRRSQKKLMKWAMVFGVLFLLLIYLALPFSKTQGVEVKGNYAYSREEIQNKAGVHQGNIFYSNLPFLVEYRLKSNPWIEQAKVSLQANQTVSIIIQEKKKIAYYRQKKDTYVLLASGKSQKLKKEDQSILKTIPYLSGFETDEQRGLLARSLKGLSNDQLDGISEIHQYSLTYDPEGIKFVMRNGGYMITGYASATLVKDFNAIYHQTKNKALCIFAIGKENTAYSSLCPWKKENPSLQYWKNDKGETLINASGDKVIQHYYSEAGSGKQAKADNGQAIKIPVNEHGYEIPDKSFDRHYEAGYYKSGTLNIKK